MAESTDIERYLVRENTRMIEAMETIDRGAKGAAVVIDSERHVVGIVTDGDIRRYILRKRDLNRPIIDTANRNFVSITPDKVDQSDEVMEWYGINILPVVDEEKILRAIFFRDDVITEQSGQKVDAPVVIMAGGKGTRLYPYTQVLPKPLIPVHGVPITMHIMNRFTKYGASEFVMIVNHQKELIKAYYSDPNFPYKIRFVDEEIPLGTAGGLKLYSSQMCVNRSFFMTNCDILIDCNYAEVYEFHQSHSNLITVVCALKKEVIPYGTITLNEDGYLEKIIEKPEHSYLINTGFYVIHPKALDYSVNHEVLTMPELMERCVAKGERVGVFPISASHWEDMGTIDLLNKMENKLL